MLTSFQDKITAIHSNGWTIVFLIVLQLPLVYLLINGGPILTKEIIQDVSFPIGTLIAWLFLILFPLMTFLFLSQTKSFLNPMVLRTLSKIALIALFSGVLWGAIGFILSGNWYFSFSDSIEDHAQRFQAFLFISLLPVFIPLIIGLAIIVSTGIRLAKSKKTQ